MYECEITAAYLIKNARADNKIDMAIHLKLPSGYEHKIQNTVLIDGKFEAPNKKTKEMELLFTYVIMSHIIGAATEGKTLGDIWDSIQVKKIELYDFEKRSDVLTDVKMVTDLVGKKVLVGLQRKISNKKTKAGDSWVDLPERKETLEFGVAGMVSDRRTYVEFNAEAEEAKELDAWEKRNAGKDWDAYKPVAGAASGTPEGVTGQSADTVIDFG